MDMPPIKWAPTNKAPTTNNGNDMLSLPVADLWLEPVQPTKCFHLVYNLEDYKGDSIPEQE